MKFCKFCFGDEEIQNLINNLLYSVGKGQCECCGKNNVELYDTGEADDLAESFADVLDVFKEAKAGKKHDLISILKHWNIFHSTVNDAKALEFLRELNRDIFQQCRYLENSSLTIPELKNKDFLKRNSILGSANWDEFKENILYRNRYYLIDRENRIGEDAIANIFQIWRWSYGRERHCGGHEFLTIQDSYHQRWVFHHWRNGQKEEPMLEVKNVCILPIVKKRQLRKSGRVYMIL